MRISRLRSALPLEIQFESGGYRVEPAQVEIDSERFETRCDQAHALATHGALLAAANKLHSALALWRGFALSNTTRGPELLAESSRLENLRSAALADRIDMDLTLGRATVVIPKLYALVERARLPRSTGRS